MWFYLEFKTDRAISDTFASILYLSIVLLLSEISFENRSFSSSSSSSSELSNFFSNSV